MHFFDLNSVNYANRFDFEGTIRGIETVNPNPKAIFLGSSLIRYSLYALDNKLFQTSTRTTDLHICQTAKGSLGSNYSFALAGILVSDSNLIFRKFMNRDITSGTVYVECSPRAFYDSGLQPTNTPAFKWFCNLQDVFSPSKAFSNNKERLLWLTNVLVPTYRFRHDIQENAVHVTAGCFTQAEKSTYLNHETGALGANSDVTHRTLQAVLANSIAEYQARYAGISMEVCAPQFNQLQDLICQIKAKRANSVLLLMPLTQANIDLLPYGFYESWKNSLKRLALNQHCTLLDLTEYHFEKSDFLDSVHLNARGAAKFLNILEARNQSV